MASITTRKNGSRFITFVDADGRSQTITLGKVAMRYVESIKTKVEDLVASSTHHHAPRNETELRKYLKMCVGPETAESETAELETTAPETEPSFDR